MKGDKFLSPDVRIGTGIISASGHVDNISSAITLTCDNAKWLDLVPIRILKSSSPDILHSSQF